MMHWVHMMGREEWCVELYSPVDHKLYHSRSLQIFTYCTTKHRQTPLRFLWFHITWIIVSKAFDSVVYEIKFYQNFDWNFTWFGNFKFENLTRNREFFRFYQSRYAILMQFNSNSIIHQFSSRCNSFRSHASFFSAKVKISRLFLNWCTSNNYTLCTYEGPQKIVVYFKVFCPFK